VRSRVLAGSRNARVIALQGPLCGVPVSASRFARLGDGLADSDGNVFEGRPFKKHSKSGDRNPNEASITLLLLYGTSRSCRESYRTMMADHRADDDKFSTTARRDYVAFDQVCFAALVFPLSPPVRLHPFSCPDNNTFASACAPFSLVHLHIHLFIPIHCRSLFPRHSTNTRYLEAQSLRRPYSPRQARSQTRVRQSDRVTHRRAVSPVAISGRPPARPLSSAKPISHHACSSRTRIGLRNDQRGRDTTRHHAEETDRRDGRYNDKRDR